MERRYKETQSDASKRELEELMAECPCPTCKGKRLKKESLAVTVGDKDIDALTRMSVVDELQWVDRLELTHQQHLIADRILKEIKSRLGFLQSVGLGYLTLSRSAGTLSGGESQRIRLATQIGSSLMGVLYILDEPPSVCTSGTTTSCWRRCRTCGTWATPCWWWSTTRTPCGRRTT